MGEVKCNTLQFDVDGLKAALRKYYINVMEKAAKRTVEVMKKELDKNGKGPRASSARIEKWKGWVSRYIKTISREVAIDYIEYTVGVADSNDELYRKAIIIAAGGGPRKAGPPGRIVWDEDYVAQQPSTAKREYALPSTWILGGNHWVDNAAKQMKVYFFDMLDSANAALPGSFFANYLLVS